MTSLTKAELEVSLIEACGLPRGEARLFIETLFETIRQTVEQGEEVKISSFGNFIARKKEARPARNPRTGKAAEVSARTVVLFHPTPKTRERIACRSSPKD